MSKDAKVGPDSGRAGKRAVQPISNRFIRAQDQNGLG